MAEAVWYLGWVDKRTDPFPQHEDVPEGRSGRFELGGRKIWVLGSDHPEWPGAPFVERAAGEEANGARNDRRRAHGALPLAWPGL